MCLTSPSVVHKKISGARPVVAPDFRICPPARKDASSVRRRPGIEASHCASCLPGGNIMTLKQPAEHPKEQGPKPPFPEQGQQPPGLEQEMQPRPDYGEQSYR